MTTGQEQLPPGQFLIGSFERFGLGRFHRRFPRDPAAVRLAVGGDVASNIEVDALLAQLPRIVQRSDFHCVTTWSVQGLEWGGYRFADFYQRIVVPLAGPSPGAEFVVLHGADGYRTCMHLPDLLRPDVLLADSLAGEPLGLAHGAPRRIVAPAHYGYKNMKHLCGVDFWRERGSYRFPFPYPGWMDHPRARVAEEERVRFLPSRWVRGIYRLLIPGTQRAARRALERDSHEIDPR